MKHAMVRTLALALVLALMLLLPGFVLADNDNGMLALPESGIDMVEVNIPEQGGDTLKDVELTLEMDGEEAIAITEEEPAAIPDGGEALE